MAEIMCYEVIYYEVKIIRKPKRTFHTEEEALKFIDENKEDFVYMTKTEIAQIDLK